LTDNVQSNTISNNNPQKRKNTPYPAEISMRHEENRSSQRIRVHGEEFPNTTTKLRVLREIRNKTHGGIGVHIEGGKILLHNKLRVLRSSARGRHKKRGSTRKD